MDSWLVGATDAGEARFTPDATGSPAQTVRFLPSVRMVLTPGGELTASVDAEAAICVDAGTGELTVSMEDAEDPTVLVCG
ncbi:hypothetical protein GCM10009592_11790 [Brachybacterium rhamnosum]|uniref:Uncharacterized protein n=1 Tax=Brachybacterium rhamnosum TaxID=173361 RepID=A0ABW4PXF3_9MICO